MTSYANTPSGFFIEYGWKGRMIDPEAWQSHEMFGGSSLLGDGLLATQAGRRRRAAFACQIREYHL